MKWSSGMNRSQREGRALSHQCSPQAYVSHKCYNEEREGDGGKVAIYTVYYFTLMHDIKKQLHRVLWGKKNSCSLYEIQTVIRKAGML